MQIIDRRLNQKNKSAINRQRFIRRYRAQIKKAIAENIGARKVTDIDKGESISISSKDISEPTFQQGKGGVKRRVYPGNKEFTPGDKIKRPKPQDNASNNSASDKGEGQDAFSFEVSSDEYMDLLFEDLELPNLKKNKLKKLVNYKSVRSGFNINGTPSNIDIMRSLKGSLARRIAIQLPIKKELAKAESELIKLEQKLNSDIDENQIHKLIEKQRRELRQHINELKKRIKRIPYIDTIDLKYKNFSLLPQPTTNAVMFCVMDVSGSMDQHTKELAKRFFILLYLFLKRTYKNVEVVYIRHHTQATEVDEEEFFYSRETGGTIVSSALNLMSEIIEARYPPSDWNIYAAQASDGDNWNDDSSLCYEILSKKILPLLRYYTYVEITARDPQNLWHQYQQLREEHTNFAMQNITKQEDIYPVFRDFFKKQSTLMASFVGSD